MWISSEIRPPIRENVWEVNRIQSGATESYREYVANISFDLINISFCRTFLFHRKNYPLWIFWVYSFLIYYKMRLATVWDTLNMVLYNTVQVECLLTVLHYYFETEHREYFQNFEPGHNSLSFPDARSRPPNFRRQIIVDREKFLKLVNFLLKWG